MYTKTNFEEYVIGDSYKIDVEDTIYKEYNYSLVAVYLKKQVYTTSTVIVFTIILSSTIEYPIGEEYAIDEEFRLKEDINCNTIITKL